MYKKIKYKMIKKLKPGQHGEVEGVVQGKGDDSKYQGGDFYSTGKKVTP